MTTQLDWCPEAVGLSPKLAWLARNRLHTRRDLLPRGYIGPWNTKPWTCANAARTVVAFGDSEDDAIWQYAQQMGIEHYAMEGVELIGDNKHTEEW